MTAFSDLITYTRTGVASYFDAYGVMQFAPANTPRMDFDPLQKSRLGFLIEEARTNLIINSLAFQSWEIGGTATVSADSVLGLDGQMSADTVTLPNTSAIIRSSQYSVAAGALHAFSVYAAKNSGSFVMQFRNASGSQSALATVNTAAGTITAGTTTSSTINSLYKVSAGPSFDRYVMIASLASAETGTARVGISGVAASGVPVLWGAMLEAGNRASSFIPTTSAAATRGADLAWANLSPWNIAGVGTLFVEGIYSENGGAFAFGVSLGTTTAGAPRIAGGKNSSDQPLLQIIDNANVNVAQWAFSPAMTFGQPVKVATAYGPDNMQAAARGVVGTRDTAGTPPTTPTRLSIGCRGTSSDFINGWVRRIRYFSGQMTDAQLQALTA